MLESRPHDLVRLPVAEPPPAACDPEGPRKMVECLTRAHWKGRPHGKVQGPVSGTSLEVYRPGPVVEQAVRGVGFSSNRRPEIWGALEWLRCPGGGGGGAGRRLGGN